MLIIAMNMFEKLTLFNPAAESGWSFYSLMEIAEY
jgi:hypothetical protein